MKQRGQISFVILVVSLFVLVHAKYKSIVDVWKQFEIGEGERGQRTITLQSEKNSGDTRFSPMYD